MVENVFSKIYALEDVIRCGKSSEKELASELLSLANEICKSIPAAIILDGFSSKGAHLYEENGRNYYLARDGISYDKTSSEYADSVKLEGKELTKFFQTWVGDYGAADCLHNLRSIAKKYCSIPAPGSRKKQDPLPPGPRSLVNKYGRKAKGSKLDNILKDSRLGSDI
jgi:hypothetical protein